MGHGIISSEISESKKVLSLFQKYKKQAELAYLTYLVLLAHTDGWGLQEADAQVLKMRLFPNAPTITPQRIESALRALIDVQLCRAYRTGGHRYLWVVNYDKHQSADFLRKRGKPKFPIPRWFKSLYGNGLEKVGQSRAEKGRVGQSRAEKGEKVSKKDTLNTNTIKEEYIRVSKDTHVGASQEETVVKPEDVARYWNETIPKPKVAIPLCSKFRRFLEVRLKEPFFREHWKEAIDRIPKTPFLRGEGPRGWRATFLFLVRNDANVGRIVNGEFDSIEGKHPEGRRVFEQANLEQYEDR